MDFAEIVRNLFLHFHRIHGTLHGHKLERHGEFYGRQDMRQTSFELLAAILLVGALSTLLFMANSVMALPI